MIVHFMCVYYSQWAHKNMAPRSQAQWDAFKFCRAVKNRRINGSLVVPLRAGPLTITEQNVGQARANFGRFIADTLGSMQGISPVIVPVPSKDGLLDAASFRSLEMIQESIAPYGNWSVAPILRFTQPLQPASQGGPRGREALRPYLRVSGTVPPGDLVLIDDLITTGGSLLPSYDALADVDRTPIAAIVCGHTVSDSLLSAFGYHQKTIDTDQQTFRF